MQKGIKLAFVMPWHISERGGGAEVQANYLAQELGRRGCDVFYVCQTTHKSKINTINKVGDIKIYFLKPSGRFQWLDQNKYLEPLNSIKPDYILQRLSSNVTYVLGKYSAKNDCKFIWFCTDNHSPFSNFHFLKFKERTAIKSLGLFKHIIFATSSKIMDYYRNKGMKQVDIAFNQNDFQEKQIKHHFNLESHRMISGHPIPEKNNSTEQRFNIKTILWCANFGTHKRPELFIELARQMQHTALKFVMVGGHSDTAYVNDLLKNKPNNLVTTGHLSFSEALNYFDETSIFVNTSVNEGFSNTYIQAWLRSVPVFVFGADSDNIIETNLLGYDVSSINEAKEKLKAILSNYETYKLLSNNAYTYGFQNHSIKVMTDNFLKNLNLPDER
ncbi:glycosyltransferase family 4 protein [Xanthomarina spongicola]|uniref:Glycosyltransferase involved in cell wall biosynthesis n=1 Tax=Xanthomarina spongicola TaxID=570520 RepID=A0A316DJA9_9FLAO|nr:glycosyltransferase family 4 protein [Xanthomarina spongicola]PWK18005.1 glycosyltransferase involved in cell wall biosynthesis [Xanthomarina spongicola]